MNRFLKIGLAIILIAAGLILVFGILSGDSLMEYLGSDDDYTYVEKTYDSSLYDSLNVTLVNKKVIIVPSDDDQVKMTYYDEEDNYLTFTETGNLLTVSTVSTYTIQWFNLAILFNPDLLTYRLYLPEDMILDLVLHTSNSQISLDGLSNFGILNLSSSNGRISLNDVSATGKITLTTTNAVISAVNVHTDSDCTFGSSNDYIYVNGLEADDVILGTTNGRIEVSNISFDTLNVTTSNGKIMLDIPGDFEDFYLKMTTTNGSYYLNDSKVSINSYHDNLDRSIICTTTNSSIHVNFSN